MKPRSDRRGEPTMHFRSFAYSSAISALLFSTSPNGAAAQSAQTEGVAVAVSGIVINPHNINVQFVITNNRKARVYLTDARTDDSQNAFLGSGVHLSYPAVANFNFCNSSSAQCISNPNETSDLNKLTYIEPGNSTALSFSYNTFSPVNENDTISISAALIARFAEQEQINRSPENLEHYGLPSHI